jgi:hypothetical protein
MMDEIIYTRKDVRDFLQNELRRYKAEIGRLTPEERRELRAWVVDENSAYDNPYHLAGESGHPLDYITATRIVEDMRQNPKSYGIGYKSVQYADSEDHELPF